MVSVTSMGSKWGNRLLLVAICLGVVGCESARFYGQAITGQVGLLVNRVAIDDVQADESTAPELRSNLERVQELKDFATTELALEPGRTYDSYVSLDYEYVAWNVAVCDEFSLEPRSWWYPIVGRLEHRGYFREQHARRYADRMRARGWEVSVGGVPAYSTLGWFRDPVLSSFWYLSEVELAELVFHELTHQRVFISGDTDFNEAFAVAVAEEGVVRWLEGQGRRADLQQYRAQLERQDLLMEWVSGLRKALERSYSRGEQEEWSLTKRREEKEACFTAARKRFRQLAKERPDLELYADWVDGSLNNAALSVLDTYYRLLPEFRRRIQNTPELGALYSWVETLQDATKDERLNALQDGHGRTARRAL